ncbi:MAG: hypothetical protein KAH20_01385 [Methylococcales bacterium]|nr:hypothetical protein [Methylococcales bacterium]
MSFKSGLIKFIYKMTPKQMVFWVVNANLKKIVKLVDYDINFDERTIQSTVHLEGEEGLIEVCLEDFTLIKEAGHCKFIIQKVQSNRPWLDNALSKFILGQEIKIPDSQTQLVQDLFSFKFSDDEDRQE